MIFVTKTRIHLYTTHAKRILEEPLVLRRTAVGSIGRLRGRLMTLSGKEGPEPEALGMMPRLAFAVSLIYRVAVDREVDAREVGRLVSAFGGKVAPDLIEVGASYRTLVLPLGGVCPNP